jgi:protein-S-isoprenylcysteine O-methyltransferase Ste14
MEDFVPIIINIVLILVVVYFAVLVLLLLLLAGANSLKRQTGKASFFQRLKQQLAPSQTNADFILHLAGRVLFHAVLFTAFIALLINLNTVRSSPLFLSLVVVILFIRLAETFTPAANGARHYHRDEDHSKITSWLLGISFFTNILAPILEFRYQAGATTPWWSWLGLLIFAAGAIIKLRAMQQAGEAFLPHVKVDSKLKLVTDGPYALVRHPSYLGLGVSYLGMAILFNSKIAAIALAVLVWPAIVFRIKKEEEMLANRFGEAWKKYANQTPARLIPQVW